ADRLQQALAIRAKGGVKNLDGIADCIGRFLLDGRHHRRTVAKTIHEIVRRLARADVDSPRDARNMRMAGVDAAIDNRYPHLFPRALREGRVMGERIRLYPAGHERRLLPQRSTYPPSPPVPRDE